MRWLVEVSRVSEGSSSERYCIDARRWQSALQEVRRLRGDEGPLPKLTIELLDSGYRAVDPELKVRYVVSEAPPEMAVTPQAQVRHSTQPPPTEDANPPAEAAVLASTAKTAPTALAPSVEHPVPAEPHSPPTAPIATLSAQVIRQREESPTAESPIHFRELALSVKPGASKDGVEALLRSRLEQIRAAHDAGQAQHYVQIAVFDHMFVKRPVRAPIATLAWKNWRGDPVLSFPGYAGKTDSRPSSPAPSSRDPSWSPADTARPASVAPSPMVVIGGSPGASSPPAAAALRSAAPVAAIPRPASVPANVQTPSFAPTVSSPAQPTRGSVVPVPVVAVGARSASSPPLAATPPAELEPPPSSDSGVEEPVPLVNRVAPLAEAPGGDDLEISVEVSPSSAPHLEVATVSVPASEIPRSWVPDPAPASEVPSSSLPVESPRAAPVPEAEPVPIERRAPASTPPPSSGGARRRSAGEDLIGELFERMHELAFMSDLVSGAEFVLHVLGELIPCEGILIHVFDLDRREFVVVRARGPNAGAALLHRTRDDESEVRTVMSRSRALLLDGAPANLPRPSAALAKLGVVPSTVLCGAVRLGGRYLGYIELANPAGGQPFHDGEANALEYVCEQFAEFVASRPIVLDEDVIVG